MAEPRKSLLRSLGEFFGHVRAGIRAPVSPGERAVVVRKEQEERREGNLILRRTVVEEVEIRREDERDHDAGQGPAR
jgi:hypothetical protein